MTHLTITSDSKEAKAFLEYAKKLPFIKIDVLSKPRYNAETEKTIKLAREGKGLNKAKNTKDLFKKILE